MSHTVTFAGSGDAFGAGGRFQTCFVVDGPSKKICIDFGASSLIALTQVGIEHRDIDAVVLTHIHGDHCGGLPFMLMDAMLGAKREKPLTIAGPRDTKRRVEEYCEVLMPGMHVMTPKFELNWVEMEVMREHDVIDGVTCTPYPALHTGETNPTSVRVNVEGKIVSYTGDSAWTKHMPKVAGQADLFICECYFYAKPIRFHMNYPDVRAHWDEFGAKRIILTHMSREMLPHADEIPEETAHDGLVIEI